MVGKSIDLSGIFIVDTIHVNALPILMRAHALLKCQQSKTNSLQFPVYLRLKMKPFYAQKDLPFIYCP